MTRTAARSSSSLAPWWPVAAVAAVGLALLLVPLWPWLVRRANEPVGASTALLLLLAALWSTSTLPARGDDHRHHLLLGAGVAAAVLVGAGSGINAAQALAVAVGLCCSVVVVRGAQIGDALTPIVLFALAIPARGDLDTFIGFPLRVVAAQIAACVLSPWLGEIGNETVLVLEGRVADVEVACSGLSTLWIGVGAALVLGALIRRHHAPTRPALTTTLTVIVTTVVLVLMTAVRVTVLSATALAPLPLEEPTRQLLGQLVHVPLGIVALIVAVAAGLLVQWAMPTTTTTTTTTTMTTTTRARHVARCWLAVGLIAAIVRPAASGAAVAHDDRDNDIVAARVQGVLGGRRIPLAPAEAALYGRHADAAIKLVLDEPAGASVLVVAATSTTPHHAPERCLASDGHLIGGVTDVVDDNGSARVIVLDAGRAVGVSFYVSEALPEDTTIAGLGDRIAIAVRARLAGEPPPRVTFVSAIWPTNSPAFDDDDSARRLNAWRHDLSRALRRPHAMELQ